MAHMSIEGLGPLIDDFAMLANMPDHVIDDMLDAGADVIVKAQRSEIQRKWKGPYSESISAKSVKKDSKIKTTKYVGITGRCINIYPQGERRRGKKRIRNAEIAFINEYGAPKRGIAARPAISTANSKAERKAVAAGEKVFHAYLDSKNL